MQFNFPPFLSLVDRHIVSVQALYNHGHICPLFDNKDTEQLLTNCQVSFPFSHTLLRFFMWLFLPQVPFDIKFSDEFDVQRHE